MDTDPVDRARRRLAALRSETSPTEITAALDRAREQLQSFAESTAELEAALPERMGTALREALREEVIPVGRQLAEVRGLSAQTIRRLERLQAEAAAERAARVEDLELLVDLVASGWQAVDRRLDRLERALDRLERVLDERRESPGSLLRPA